MGGPPVALRERRGGVEKSQSYHFSYEIYCKLQIQRLEKFSIKKIYPTIAFNHKSLEAGGGRARAVSHARAASHASAPARKGLPRARRACAAAYRARAG